MSSRAQHYDQAVATTVEIALDGVRVLSPAAHQLISLCSFLAGDDIPRKLLYSAANELPEEMRTAVANPGALQNAVEILDRYALIRVSGDGLALHRTHQAAIRDGLPVSDRRSWAIGAARIVLASLPARPEKSREWPWTARLLPHALATADHLDDLGVDVLLAVHLWDNAARYMIAQGQLDTAEDIVGRALERIARAAPGGELHGTVLNRLATVERERGRFSRAHDHASQALGMHQASVGGHQADESSAQTAPRPASTRDAHLGSEVATIDHPAIAEDLQNLAVIARQQGHLAEAMRYLRSAYEMLVKLHGEDDATVSDAVGELFQLFVEMDDIPNAIAALERSIEIDEAVYGPDDEDVALERQIFLLITEPENQDERAREALRLSERSYGPRHPFTADANRLLSALLRRLDRLDEARQMAIRALDIDRVNLGAVHFRVARGLADLMAVDAAAGEIAAACERLGEIAAIVIAAPSDERVTTLRLSGLGDVLADAAQHERGASLVERAITVLDTAFAGHDNALEYSRGLVVRALLVAGDTLLRDGHLTESAAKYAKGRQLALLTAESFLDDAVFEIRLAFVAGARAEREVMVEYLQAAMEHLSKAGDATPIWYVITECSRLCGLFGRMPILEEVLARLMQQEIEGDAVPQFRGKLTAAIPNDWFAKESTTVLAPDGRSNVIASSEPLDPTIDSDQYAAIQGDLLRKEFDEFEEKEFEAITLFGGRSGYLRRFEWKPQDSARVTQIQLYYVENARGYTATATTPSDGFAERELLLREILLGLSITD